MIRCRCLMPSTLLLLALTVVSGPARAQPSEPKVPRWQDTADFSLVMTAGNTEVSTFGLRNKLWRTGEKSMITFDVGGLRSKRVNTTRFAIGDSMDFRIVEETMTELIAENYYVDGVPK